MVVEAEKLRAHGHNGYICCFPLGALYLCFFVVLHRPVFFSLAHFLSGFVSLSTIANTSRCSVVESWFVSALFE